MIIVLGLLRDSYQRLNSYYERFKIQAWAASFDFDSKAIVYSQESIVSIDESIQLTAISDLTLDRVRKVHKVNVKGRCVDKGSFNAKHRETRFTFLLVDGESSVLVTSRCIKVFRKVVDDEYYLLKDASIEIRRSGGTNKVRILLDDIEKISHCSKPPSDPASVFDHSTADKLDVHGIPIKYHDVSNFFRLPHSVLTDLVQFDKLVLRLVQFANSSLFLFPPIH